ncbi:MAG: molecular chaperone TorD family protein [Campylobacteraceae bacterium]|nr:molecular chaperone TorD family protein [Campylobacteraceae bacterium]
MIDKTTTNKARSLYYGLLSKLLVYSTEDNRFEGVDDALAIICTNPLDEYSEKAAKQLLNTIDTKGFEYLSDEFEMLFHIFYGKEVRTSASHYLEGVETGRKLVEVRDFIAKTRIRRNEALYKDNEDTVPFLLSFMHDLVELSLKGEKSYENIQHCLFSEIINPFIDYFIKDLFEHKRSDAYKDVAIILNSFMEFERLYFEVSKPAMKEVVKTKKELEEEKEMARRAANKAKRDAERAAKSAC